MKYCPQGRRNRLTADVRGIDVVHDDVSEQDGETRPATGDKTLAAARCPGPPPTLSINQFNYCQDQLLATDSRACCQAAHPA